MVKKEKIRVAILDYSNGNVIFSIIDCINGSEDIENELSKKYSLNDIHWMALGENGKILISADTA